MGSWNQQPIAKSRCQLTLQGQALEDLIMALRIRNIRNTCPFKSAILELRQILGKPWLLGIWSAMLGPLPEDMRIALRHRHIRRGGPPRASRQEMLLHGICCRELRWGLAMCQRASDSLHCKVSTRMPPSIRDIRDCCPSRA